MIGWVHFKVDMSTEKGLPKWDFTTRSKTVQKGKGWVIETGTRAVGSRWVLADKMGIYQSCSGLITY